VTDFPLDALTWTALLGRWLELAQAAVALPADATGRRWRRSVPDVIRLQAVACALGDLTRVPEADRPYARDRAEVLIVESAGSIETIWRGEPLPGELDEIIGDARTALAASVYAGAIELGWPGPGTYVMPAAPPAPTDEAIGTLAVMAPGTIVMPGEPVAWWVERDGAALARALAGCAASTPDVPHQVYRKLDDDGRIIGDVIAPVLADPVVGLPLLIPLFEQGRVIGRFTMDAGVWEQRQRAAMGDRGEITVEWG
jgi:hypothetical protein